MNDIELIFKATLLFGAVGYLTWHYGRTVLKRLRMQKPSQEVRDSLSARREVTRTSGPEFKSHEWLEEKEAK